MEMPIVGNENFINSLYDEAGRLSIYETPESVSNIVAQLERAKRSIGRNNADTKGRYSATRRLDSVATSQSSDRGRDNGETDRGSREADIASMTTAVESLADELHTVNIIHITY